MELVVAKAVIVLERVVAKKVSEGGIHLPDNAQKQMNTDKTAKVVEMGVGVKGICKIGDTVVFSPAYVNAVVLGKRYLIFCKEENILAVIKD